MNEYIPPAGIDWSGNVCDCICHQIPGVMHCVACCDVPLPELICSECKKEIPKHRRNCSKKEQK